MAPADTARIDEAWVSEGHPDDELDSLAVWPTPQGRQWLIATAKSSHTLVVFDGDSGQRLRSVGGPGDGPGQFRRPNGIAVFADIVFVTERDNHRVQMLHLPDFTPLGSFGEHELRVPYGLWLGETRPQQLDLYVTDSYMADFRIRLLPPMDELSERVKHYRIDLSARGKPRATLLGTFGDTSEAGALRMVESIAGDPAHDRLLIADEDLRVGSTLRDYTLAGRYRGYSLPSFQTDAEGVALWACDADGGYWIAVDQTSPSIFRLYDRASLRPVGQFSGRVVADTDGLALQAAGSVRFPAGALYVQHNNQAVAAFDLRDVVRALHLSPHCVQ